MNTKRKVIAVIPARMGSSRFPGKPLVNILGLPMIEHVRRRARLCPDIDEVYVATCDQDIKDAVERHGGKAIMTAHTHQRCTDRVAEAMGRIKGDIVVIVSGDEPIFSPQSLQALIIPMLADPKLVCVNLLSFLHTEEELRDVNIVKAVVSITNSILCFSRSPLPFVRVPGKTPLYRQTGLSAFTTQFLNTYLNLPPTPLEITESVDYLRILEHGYSILGVPYEQRAIGVDLKEHVAQVEHILHHDPVEKELFEQILRI